MEQWKDIPGFDNYMVSDQGRVWNKKLDRCLETTNHKDGYLQVKLKTHKRYTKLVHRLVMQAFVGECPEGHEVNHINGIKTDNRLENLEYVTHHNNILHSIYNKFSKWASGEKHGRSKLTWTQVKEIRNLWNSGNYSKSELARIFKVTHTNIASIVLNKTWIDIKNELEYNYKEKED